jgi:hypothetical protein
MCEIDREMKNYSILKLWVIILEILSGVFIFLEYYVTFEGHFSALLACLTFGCLIAWMAVLLIGYKKTREDAESIVQEWIVPTAITPGGIFMFVVFVQYVNSVDGSKMLLTLYSLYAVALIIGNLASTHARRVFYIDHTGFDRNGYDQNGYDHDGLNRDGFDRDGFDRDGYDRRDCDLYGFDRDGYNSKGYDRDGYKRNGYDPDGYDRDGYDIRGFNRQRIHRNGTSYDDDGYCKDGYDREGYNLYGLDRDGYNRKGYDRDDYGKDGYDRGGYNLYGLDRDGYNRKGYDRDGYDRDGYDIRGFNRQRIHRNRTAYDDDGYNCNGYDCDGYDKSNFHFVGLSKNEIDELSKEQKEIFDILTKCRVDRLVHFTQRSNLDSINKYGIVPVSMQESQKITSSKNDPQRLDGKPECTSLSIERPNSKLLYIFKNRRHRGKEYVLISLYPKLLFSSRIKAYYYPTNAADHRYRNLPRRNFMSSDCLKEAIWNMDLQSEILIEGIIDPSYIISVENC